MVFSFAEKTIFTKAPSLADTFTSDEQALFIAAMQRAYDGSGVARTMFHNWIDAGKLIEIRKATGVLQSPFPLPSGVVEFDLSKLNDLTFIDTHGTVAKADLFQVFIHELGHALAGKPDGTDGTLVLDYTKPDYKGDNVIYTNQIFAAVGDPERLSYIAVDSGGSVHKAVGFNYTNGAAVDVAVTIHTGAGYSPSGDFNSGISGNTRDLLIGDHQANTLQSGDGDDFLVGNRDDDDLNGGGGKDTAIYFDLNPANYDIRRSDDGKFWVVDHVRGDASEGLDTLVNMEQIQFGKATYQLVPGGLKFQTDIAFVIDTTGSMFDDIDAVEASAGAIIDELFADGTIDARIGIVTFRDTTIGEPSTVVLPFTDQDSFADRKAAAINALASISTGGGGDLPETPDDGLLHALNGDMGEWRVGAGVHRIIMFTDAEAKDIGLRAQVDALASSIGAVISSSSSLRFAGGFVDTFSFASGYADGDPHGGTPPTVLGSYPATTDTSVGTLQIFTILTGSGSGVDTSGLRDIANLTGGSFLTAPTPEDLVDTILNIVEYNLVQGTPASDKNLLGTEGKDRIDGLAGADKMSGLGDDDLYIVDNKGDKITEQLGGGIDTVESSVTHKLGKNVENLSLTGDLNINGTGNTLDNIISGNAGNNIVDGGGKKGGNDTFVFQGNFGDDTIKNLVGNGASAGDTIQFDSAIFANFDEVLAATTDIGKSLKIDAGLFGTIILDKVADKLLLNADDFTFV